MIIAAVICEYNPFHNGHKYQLNKIRQDLNADYIICIMSGSFVQRGEPAIADKFLRTRIALTAGADMVIELPVCFSAAASKDFAFGAVSLVNYLGCVDYLCFGSESSDEFILNQIADILLEESPNYSQNIKAYLSDGLSFPVARSRAVIDELGMNDDIVKEVVRDIMSSSNDILAIEYILALKQLKSTVKPYVLKRRGMAYNSSDLNVSDLSNNTYFDGLSSENAINPDSWDDAKHPDHKSDLNLEAAQDLMIPQDAVYPSATALRGLLHKAVLEEKSDCILSIDNLHDIEKDDHFTENGIAGMSFMDAASLKALEACMPKDSLDLIIKNFGLMLPVGIEDISPEITYSLIQSLYTEEGLTLYGDISRDLSDRIKSYADKYTSPEDICNAVSTKNIPYTRVRRALIQTYIGIKKEDFLRFRKYGPAYIRVLGFKKDSEALFSIIKDNLSKAAAISDAVFMKDLSNYLPSIASQTGRGNRNRSRKKAKYVSKSKKNMPEYIEAVASDITENTDNIAEKLQEKHKNMTLSPSPILFTQLSEAKSALLNNEYAQTMLNYDLKAYRLYQSILNKKFNTPIVPEESHKVVVL